MSKIKVQLKDKNACFYDRKNQIFIASPEPVEVEETAKIAEGIRFGALIKVDVSDVKVEEQGVEKDKQQKESGEEENLEEEAEKASELIKSLSEDKPDFEATDYEVLKEWAGILKLTPASRKKDDYVAALTEAVASFEGKKE